MNLPKKLPKTVIIGASSFIGSVFFSEYSKIHPDCIGTSRTLKGKNIVYLDLLKPDISKLKLKEKGHKEALIFAAISKIIDCEENKVLTKKVNVEGTLNVVKQLVNEGIKPIFFSSDLVFDGKTGNYSDDSKVNPILEYGKQKAEVEKRIKEITDNYLIIRLSKIFSLNKDESLLDEMAKILASGGKVKAAYDLLWCPTLITDLIPAVAKLQVLRMNGTANVCSPEIWSRYELALEVAKAMQISSENIIKISINDLPGPARPKNISMKTSKLKGVKFTSMKECIKKVVRNWK